MTIQARMAQQWASNKTDAELAALVRDALSPQQLTTATKAQFAESLVRLIAAERGWDAAIETAIAELALDFVAGREAGSASETLPVGLA